MAERPYHPDGSPFFSGTRFVVVLPVLVVVAALLAVSGSSFIIVTGQPDYILPPRMHEIFVVAGRAGRDDLPAEKPG